MTLRTVLLSLQALLAAAEPDDPQDAVVAKQFKDNPDIFKKTARHWANIYAGGENTPIKHSPILYPHRITSALFSAPKKVPDLDQQVDRMRAMGFEDVSAHVPKQNRIFCSTYATVVYDYCEFSFKI